MLKLKAFLLIALISPLSSFAFIPSIEDTIFPKEWLYAGPFSFGIREGVVGVVDSIKGFVPKEGEELPSILAQGGKVLWKKTEPDSQGEVEFKYENVLWDTLEDYYGYAGTLSLGYGYSRFENNGNKKALAIVRNLGSFTLNGRKYIGNIYNDKYMLTPVILKNGKNELFIDCRAGKKFSIKFIPVPSPVMIIHDATTPDVFEYKSLSSWFGLSLLNTTSKRLGKIKVSYGDGKYFKIKERKIENLHPLSIKKEPLRIETKEEIKGKEEIFLPIKITFNGEEYKDSIKLRVKKEGEPYKVTFVSKIDSSVQYYAVLPPKGLDEDKEYALILALHGAGVRAYQLVEPGTYTPKEWAFIVAPTNRRRFGFDWEDWGRLHTLQVLEDAKKRFPIDTNRVYLTGHSMGGHGVWHIGLSHPDLFAAIAPSAGWTSIWLYIPWFLQKSEIFCHPSQLVYRDMVLREINPLVFLENALNLPIFVMQGGIDNNVPPIQARMFIKYLKQIGYPVEYMEVPGKGHWWMEDTIPGAACVNHPKLMRFLKSHIRNPYPQHVIFKTSNISLNDKSYWVRIDKQELPYCDSKIEAKIMNDIIKINTEKVSAFTLKLKRLYRFFINGKLLNRRKGGEVYFYKKGKKFVFGKKKEKKICKRPNFYGPMKQAYFAPFILVYGTIGDSSANYKNYNRAWEESWEWWQRGNGISELLPDTEVTDEIIEKYNLILFGGPYENSITKRINPKLPIRIFGENIYLGKEKLLKEDLFLQEIYPNPLNPNKFILLYTGTFFPALRVETGIPDFLIYDESVRKRGWEGVKVAGFFDENWKLTKRLYYRK